jgi:hypothetical protein
MKFLLASLKTVLLKIVPKAASNFCSGFPLLSSVNFFQCIFIAGFRNNFRDTGGYQKAGTSSLKRVTGRIFTICKWFHRSKQKLKF